VSKSKNSFKQSLRTYTMVFALLAIWAVNYASTDGVFLAPENLANLARQMSVTAILATAMTLIIVAGHVDLAVGSTVGFVGAVMTILHVNQGMGAGLSFALALGLGLVIGVAQGYLVAYQRVPAFIVTLGGMLGFRGLAMWITEGNTIPLPDTWIKDLGSAYLPVTESWVLGGVASAVILGLSVVSFQSKKSHGVETASFFGSISKSLGLAALVLGFTYVMNLTLGIPVPVIVMLSLAVVFHFVAQHTTFGRHVYAIGGNSEAAFLSGINVRMKTLMVFSLMGVLSAIAASVLTARVGSASPDAGNFLELDAIAACVIGGTSLVGGKGTVAGAILGALVMESLNNGMSLANMESFWQYIVKGVVLVVAVWADMATQDRKI
jgi:D-xylose transport system permease protein